MAGRSLIVVVLLLVCGGGQGELFLGTPIWSSAGSSAEFVYLRKIFTLDASAGAVVVQVTAQASPAWASLDDGNAPKLFGGYKLAINGHLVSMGCVSDTNLTPPTGQIDGRSPSLPSSDPLLDARAQPSSAVFFWCPFVSIAAAAALGEASMGCSTSTSSR